jgi:predicted metal-dependent HD superfamily phosphohydrolase
MNYDRWETMLLRLGLEPESQTFLKLQAAYSEKHRAYHTLRHIHECLSNYDQVKDLAERPAEVELALWFHDAIYEPMSKNNEERSADWAAAFARGIGAKPDLISRVRGHILATRHVDHATGGDSGLVVDIDLGILGAPNSRYLEFERDVRLEYKWVPGFLYRRKRARILQSFLDRPRIYHWDAMYERFESQARANLGESVQALSSRR